MKILGNEFAHEGGLKLFKCYIKKPFDINDIKKESNRFLNEESLIKLTLNID